jgi:hypothetical protein
MEICPVKENRKILIIEEAHGVEEWLDLKHVILRDTTGNCWC